MTTLTIAALAKSFRAGTPGCSATAAVLRNVHLMLWPGEIVALEGARGSGKSTLLRCAAGLLRPDAGSILWLGGRSMPRHSLAYLSARGGDAPGALYSALEQALAHRPRLLLLDTPSSLGPFERRIIISMLLRTALTGSCVFIASNDGDNHDLSTASFVSRTVTLEHGTLTQRRKRSAARIAASSPAARARSSARSTYGRSLRSPQ